MAQSIFLGPQYTAQDSLRAIQEKLNANFAELFAASPYPAAAREEIKLTLSSSDGTVDGPRETQRKINANLRAIGAVTAATDGAPAPSVRLNATRADTQGLYSSLTDALSAYMARAGTALQRGVGTTVNPTSSVTGWTVASNFTQTTSAYPTPAPSGRTTGLKLAKPASGTFSGTRTATLPANFRLDQVALIGMWLHWSADQGSVSLRFSSDAFAAKRVEFSWAYSGQLHKGWNFLTVRTPVTGDGTLEPGVGTWVNTGAQGNAEVINGVQISVATSGATAVDIYVDGIYAYNAAPAKGGVRFGFDRYGEASIPALALPILRDRQIKGYWAGDGNLIDGNTAARGMLATVYDAGWDAISQGMNHPDYTSVGAAKLGADFETARAIFRAQGFTRAADQLFSYPLSANDASTDAMLLSKGVLMARSGWAWDIHGSPYAAGPKLVGHGAVNLGGKTLTTARRLVDRAVTYGVTVDFFCHGLTAGGDGTTPPGDTLLWYENDWRALVDYAVAYRAAGTLDIDSPTEWLAKRVQAPVVA